jgi:microcystin-dependent protein
MATLPLVITALGRAALVNAQATGTNAVVIAAVGVTATPFVAADTLTALPGEIKRVSTVAGEATAPDRMNLVLRDDDEVTYSMRGFGLYTDGGVLFATYSANQVIIEKSALASMLITMDVAFLSPVAALIQFGDMSWTNPQATVTRKGVSELATDAETVTGTDAERTVTPHGLWAALNSFLAGSIATALGLKADKARSVTGGGLASGGGDLSADRVINVSEASNAEALAGTSSTTVLTPRRGKALIDALVAAAPGALDTLNELAAALGNDPNFAATTAAAIGTKAPLNSPALTGTPTAPTPAGGDPGGRIANKTYVDAGDATLTAAIAAARTLIQDERRGDMVFRATQTVPAGAYECDGRALARTGADATLFAAIGTAYGPGDGATTFNIPDMRGEFPRGWDHGRNLDPGRVWGSTQLDDFKSHSHTLPSHSDANAGDNSIEDSDGTGATRSASTGSTGGTETRPHNVAGMWIIWR